MNEALYCIYRIVCTVTGKCYVGQTANIREREIQHFRNLKTCRHHSTRLLDAYQLYGQDAFCFEMIEDSISKSDINARESYWIAYFDSFENGYNMTNGGRNPPLNCRSVEWDGIRYDSITAAAKANGVSHACMAARLKARHKSARDLKKPSARQKAVYWNGERYSSVSAAARALGISPSSMLERLKKGYTCDVDVRSAKRVVKWGGIIYDSIRDAARANSVAANKMHYWLSRGWNCDEDVKSSDLHPNSKSCEWNGFRFESLAEAARINGITVQAMWGRLKKGYTCDEDMKRGLRGTVRIHVESFRRDPRAWRIIKRKRVRRAQWRKRK